MKNPTKFKVVLCALVFAVVNLSPANSANSSSPTTSLVTCVNLESGKERISKDGSCLSTQAVAKWRLVQSDTAIATGANSKQITVCSNLENSTLQYRLIRTNCPKHQVRSIYSRSTLLPTTPVIANVVAYSDQSASISLARDPAINPDAPVAYYTISISNGETRKVKNSSELRLLIGGLKESTTYSFTVTATNADGTSPVSVTSQAVTTKAYVPPAPAATTAPAASVLAAPAFTLSAFAETVTVNTSARGFTVASDTGGTIASFEISATPAGMSFNPATGELSGTPNTVRSATSYTITATNASGSATQTFALTVTAVIYTVGSTGPGGGLIYYVSDSGFNCGTGYTNTGSPTGGLCNYLEVAPSGWSGVELFTWASTSKNSDTVPGITNRPTAYNNFGGVGLGFMNSQAISSFDGDMFSLINAATAARNYRGGGKNDWYLPTSAELNLLCQWVRGVASSVTTSCSGGIINSATYGANSAGFSETEYWTSEADTTIPNRSAYVQTFGTAHPMFGSQYQKSKASPIRVRPIRAF